jgi:hypothetical protein
MLVMLLKSLNTQLHSRLHITYITNLGRPDVQVCLLEFCWDFICDGELLFLMASE